MYNRELLSERLNKVRKEKNWTQKELAEKAEVTAATISAYEKGIKTPVLETVIKLADALEVSIDWLCGAETTQKEIETYSDVITKLMEALRFIRYGVNCYTDPSGRDKCEISVYSIALKPFIQDLSKMKHLLDDETIDENIFDSWIDGQLKKYNIKIPQQMESITEEEIDELPF